MQFHLHADLSTFQFPDFCMCSSFRAAALVALCDWALTVACESLIAAANCAAATTQRNEQLADVVRSLFTCCVKQNSTTCTATYVVAWCAMIGAVCVDSSL